MKIKSLQISNVLSFWYAEDITLVPEIEFNKDLSILIWQNGAGKSTVVEVINFIFKRVILIPYNRNRDLYGNRGTINVNQKKQILGKVNDIQNYRGFRLDRNYDFEDKPQKIRVVIELDDIDKENINHLKNHRDKLSPQIDNYSAERMFSDGEYQDSYQIDIDLDSANKNYSVNVQQDIGFAYLSAYHLYKEIIEIYNEENPENPIDNLFESFALIGSYRNYSSYSQLVSIGGDNTESKQIQDLRLAEFSKSTNSAENGEPSIFSLVRLRMAGHCLGSIRTKMDESESETAANNLDFVKRINEKLEIINLRIEIKLKSLSKWEFSFSFVDTRRNRIISDINSLSAGQKAIMHLVFEAYGRGNLKGGLVIIDEPEIHLHYQFQHEYLRVIERLNSEQGCQYVIVTHSEALINSKTISNVVRFSLDEHGYTKISRPSVTTTQKWLVKILDNTRSTQAFFGSRVLLVEWDSDRYFFRALLNEIEEKIQKGLYQDVAILDISWKGNVTEWRNLFDSFGLKTFFLADLDHSIDRFYPSEKWTGLKTPDAIRDFKSRHADLQQKIEAEYSRDIFILKDGDLETYLWMSQKDLSVVIDFCENKLKTFLVTSDPKIEELKNIMAMVTGCTKDDLW